MIKMKGGFTIIEVSLFLAITGLLFLGVTVGVQNSIFQQRYNDSVQNFVEFLRSAYSKIENVQSAGVGNTSQAIYGKLITFGEEKTLTGATNDDEIYMYDVIGDAKCNSDSGVLATLRDCNADVINNANGAIKPYYAESYRPRWSAAIQNNEEDTGLFKGAILIVRSPQSGTVYTFVMGNNTIEVNQGVGLSNYLEEGRGFTIDKNVDFCVNPDGNEKNSRVRADVRIVKGAQNATGIEIMPDNENECVKRD